MSVSIGTFAFPRCSKYVAELQMDPGGSIGVAKIWIQVHGVSGSWDWYVNNKGWCYANVYIDGNHVWSSDVATWGANGSGLNGVQHSQWQSFAASVSKNSKIKLTIDCSKGPKITGYGALGYLDTGELSPNWASVVTFTVPPTITSVYNNNKYNNQAAISDATDSISIGVSTGGDAPTSWSYWHANTGWVTMPSNPFTIPGLSAGTNYYVEIAVANEAGSPPNKGIWIRTRWDKPTITELKTEGTITTSATIVWTASKNCQQVAYRWRDKGVKGGTEINTGWNDGWTGWTYINLYNNESNGTFDVNGLIENHNHEIQVSVLSTSSYDSLWSDNYSIGVTSIQPAFLLTPLNFEFGLPFTGYRNNPSGLNNVIRYYIASTMEEILTVNTGTNIENAGDLKFSHTKSNPKEEQEMWDKLYKSLEGTSNQLKLKVKIGTITEDETIYRGQSDDVDYYDATLTLTGKMKTISIFAPTEINPSGEMCRVQGWVEEQDILTECVAWIGVAEDPNNPEETGRPQRSI